MIKIKLHSITDLITNSSTTIFTYSEGCEDALKDMINEIIKTFDLKKGEFSFEPLTCEEMFDMVVLNDEVCKYEEYIQQLDTKDYPEGVDENTDVEKLYNAVKHGKIKKPKWFEDAEEQETCCEYYRADTYLYLVAKDPKYVQLAEKIKEFLYSTAHEASEDR